MADEASTTPQGNLSQPCWAELSTSDKCLGLEHSPCSITFSHESRLPQEGCSLQLSSKSASMEGNLRTVLKSFRLWWRTVWIILTASCLFRVYGAG